MPLCLTLTVNEFIYVNNIYFITIIKESSIDYSTFKRTGYKKQQMRTHLQSSVTYNLYILTCYLGFVRGSSEYLT